MPKIKVSLGLDEKDYDRYIKMLENFEGNTEKRINEYLHEDATDLMVEKITDEMPKSNRDKAPSRGHAKDSKWFKTFDWDLAASVSNKTAGTRETSFYYLFYPHEGTKYIKYKNPFAERGLEKSSLQIADGLFKTLSLGIKEDIK